MLGSVDGDEGVMWPDFIDSLTSASDDVDVADALDDAIVVA